MDMNNEKISDAERNEELFEYEMTEVMMKLNGQLAEYHGSGLQVDMEGLESEKLGAEIKISEIEVENKAEKIQDIPKAKCNAKIAAIEIKPSAVNLQAIPVQKPLKVAKVETKEIEQENLNLNVNINTDISIKKVVVDMPEMRKIKNAVSVKKIAKIQPESSRKTMEIVTKNVSNTICDLKIDVKEHEYPKTTINNIPKITNDISIGKTSDVKIPSMLSLDNSHINTEFSGESLKSSVKVTNTKKFNIPQGNIEFSKEDLKNNVIKLEEINTKNLRIECDKNINPSKINCEYPTVEAISLASAKIENTMKNFNVEAPDFSEEIRAIVESAV